MSVTTREQIYKLRRQNMRDHLSHGDIKILASKLLERYPDISKSGLKDFANYLAQIFNPKSKRAFKEDLARKIESVWPGLNSGDLDRSPEELEYRKARDEDFEHEIEFQESEINRQEREIGLKQAEVGYKEDSRIPLIAVDALKWRLLQHLNNTHVNIEENKVLKIGGKSKIADLLLRNADSNEIILVVETGFQKGLERLRKLRELSLLMEHLKAKKGLLAIYDNEEFDLTWI